MNAWHTFADSDAFRRFAKDGPGRHLFRTRAYRRLNLERHRLLAGRALGDSGRFHEVRTFCCFIGHTKSGASMVGALLDAHPEVVLSDEHDVLRYVEAGFNREQLFHLMDRAARVEARGGRVTARRLEPYSYWVPDGAQGRCERPHIVGDSTSGATTLRLAGRPGVLERLSRVMGPVDVRLVQVIRNPFDVISVTIVRGRRSFENAIDHYFTRCELLLDVRRLLEPAWLLPVHHEDFVADPEHHLAAICRFLGVEASQAYLRDCGAIIRRQPDRSRDLVAWTRRHIDEVERRIARIEFLEGYVYDDR